MHRPRTAGSTMRLAVIAVATALLAGLSACSGADLVIRAQETPAASADPSATPGVMTPSPTPEATPSATQPPANPINLLPNTGTGPGGSLRITGTKAVALTFDDGPDPVHTPRILNLLKTNGVKATFCVVGFRARDHPDLIRRIVAEGHAICNHSWQHLMDLGKHTDAFILKDLGATNAAIRRAVPEAKINYFRAPGGYFSAHLVALARSMGMRSIYWAVDTRDWEASRYGHGSSMVNHIIASVKGSTRPGSIVLSHDLNKPDTITAYATLLPWLKARFVVAALPT